MTVSPRDADVIRDEARIRLILESSIENTTLWPEVCAACRDEDPFGRDDHDEDCPHALHAASFVALDRLVARGHALERALLRIAESYPWEPYEDDEVVRKPHESISGAWYTTEVPTNRRIARAVVLEGAAGQEDLGGSVPEPVVPS